MSTLSHFSTYRSWGRRPWEKKAGAWENFPPPTSLCNGCLPWQVTEVCPPLPTPGRQEIDGYVWVCCSFRTPPDASVTLLIFALKRWQIHKYLLSPGSRVHSVLPANTALPSSPPAMHRFHGPWGRTWESQLINSHHVRQMLLHHSKGKSASPK